MSIETKKISELEQLTTVSETANVLIEDGGKAKRIPATKVGVTSWNDLSDRPFGENTMRYVRFSETVDVPSNSWAEIYAGLYDDMGEVPEKVIVVLDGLEYPCVPHKETTTEWVEEDGEDGYEYEIYKSWFGNQYLYDSSRPNTGEPFCVFVCLDGDFWEEYGRLYCENAGEHDIDIYEEYSEIKTIDPIYLPDTSTEDDSITVYWDDIENRPFGEYTVRETFLDMYTNEFEWEEIYEEETTWSTTIYTDDTVNIVAGKRYEVTVGESTGTVIPTHNGILYYEYSHGEDEEELEWITVCVEARNTDHIDVSMTGNVFAEYIKVVTIEEKVKTIDTKYLTKATEVPDAMGETVTAEEFNALLTALRQAGYLATE